MCILGLWLLLTQLELGKSVYQQQEKENTLSILICLDDWVDRDTLDYNSTTVEIHKILPVFIHFQSCQFVYLFYFSILTSYSAYSFYYSFLQA